MAALIRHGLRKGGQEINTCGIIFMISRSKTEIVKPSYKMKYNKKKKPFPTVQLDPTEESIAAKGFHRPQKPYNPPQDVADRITSIYESVTGTRNISASSSSSSDFQEIKFKFLDACCQEFQHSVPNSLLSTMLTVDDVLEFYKTPVVKSTPLDALKSIHLPENLHIQTEYHRFHPETDTLFKGISAFPESSTIVTGLRYKKKYKGYVAKIPWPNNSRDF